MDYNKIIAYKIKRLRESQHLSAEYVASKIPLSKGAYSNIENGKTEITLLRLHGLAKIFNVPISFLLPEENINLVNISNNVENILNSFDNINNNADPRYINLLQNIITALNDVMHRMKNVKDVDNI